MNDEPDFSELSDDQIVELAVALAREAMLRNPALQAAFGQALLDERERVEAAMRGTETARREAKAEIEQQARRAEDIVQKEQLRLRERDALAGYLRRAAQIMARPVSEITLVWQKGGAESHYSPAGEYGQWLLQINAGTTGTDARWHLLSYVVKTQSLHLSPAQRANAQALQAWARECYAAIRALNIGVTRIIKGVEL